mgnify:FL=1
MQIKANKWFRIEDHEGKDTIYNVNNIGSLTPFYLVDSDWPDGRGTDNPKPWLEIVFSNGDKKIVYFRDDAGLRDVEDRLTLRYNHG